jgi:hypothetical protein
MSSWSALRRCCWKGLPTDAGADVLLPHNDQSRGLPPARPGCFCGHLTCMIVAGHRLALVGGTMPKRMRQLVC